MSGQLPDGAEGAVALSMIFAYISWACSTLMIWLTWTHNERLSYVACLAYFTLLSTTASIIQQIHDIAWWRDIAIEQYRRKVSNPDSGDISIANGSVGLDLILYYIQFYSYIAESLFVLFWASELAQSVYLLIEKTAWRRILRRVNASGKIASVVVPLIFILAIQAHIRKQNSKAGSELILGIPFSISVGLGSILMLAILYRYIQSRRKLVRFYPHYRVSLNSGGSDDAFNRMSQTTAAWRHKGIYDKWLMTRFTIAFILLAVFQVSTVLFDQTAKQNSLKDIQASAPDLSIQRARLTFFLFLPGNTPGIAIFVIFGTTATFRSYMYQTFVPQRWHRIKETLLTRSPSTSTAGRARRTSTVMFSLQKMREKRGVAVTAPASNDGAGFSFPTYEPVRPARIAGWNGRHQDLEWGAVENNTSTILKYHGSRIR
ncbi:hypothetical protein HD806DRAFT_447489 [Xylariaceae sp. AK1471]|nr:hypothetical protein HD806DRAFT_447489 [Xylariaceae sp. AK1471]